MASMSSRVHSYMPANHASRMANTIFEQLMARHGHWVSPADTPEHPVFRE